VLTVQTSHMVRMDLQPGLFTSLATYAASHKASPLENFTTELLGWMVNREGTFGREFWRLLRGERLDDGANVGAETQYWVPGGFVDLRLSASTPSGSTAHILVENKVDAGIGERAGLAESPRDDKTDNGQREMRTQLDTYLEYAAAQPAGTLVVLLTKNQVDYSPANPALWLHPKRWHEVHSLLGTFATREDSFGFVAQEARQLMIDNDMALEPVGPDLLKGTPERVKLAKILQESVRVACAGTNLVAGQPDSDRWGYWVNVKKLDAMRRKQDFAVLGYSDQKHEVYLALLEKRYRDGHVVNRLLAHPRLGGFRPERKSEFGGFPNFRIHAFDPEFFAASGAHQVALIAEQCRLKVAAIFEAIPEGS